MRPVLVKFVLAAAILILLAGASPSRAAAVIDVLQVGSNVVATGSGSVDTDGLNLLSSSGNASPQIFPSGSTIFVGSTVAVQSYVFVSITGPSYGSGGQTFASSGSGSGDLFGVGDGEVLFLPQGYVSGTALSATDTYDNATFASLGLTPGTYTYTWGTGDDADSLTLQIGPSAVPLPSPLAASSVGLILAAGWACWRRRSLKTRAYSRFFRLVFLPGNSTLWTTFC